LSAASATSAPLFQLFIISGTFATKAAPLYATNTSHRNQETFIYEYHLYRVLLPTKKETQHRMLLFGSILLKHDHHFHY
jgi:hypothetical protein